MNPIAHYSVNEVCSLLGIGRTKLYELLATEEIRSMKIGRVRRISHHELERYCAAAQAES